MNGPTLLHLIVGIVIAALGVWQLRRRSPVLGWILCVGGAAFAVSGFAMREMHRFLFH